MSAIRLSQKCEFSYTCDGSTLRKRDKDAWNRVARIAYDYKHGKIGHIDGVHFYHNIALKNRPRFSKVFPKRFVEGRHVFYSCDGFKYC